MIQLNLLPDVKLQYIKARQNKRMVMSIAFIASVFFVAILIILLVFVRIGQQGHIGRLSKDIETKTSELQEKENLAKILTIQNQLNSLPNLHDQKAISSRLFDYLAQLTPADATISDVDVVFGDNTLEIKGNTKNIGIVNKFVDTLKFTGFVVNSADGNQPACTFDEIAQNNVDDSNPQTVCRAFNEVVLKEFSLGTGNDTVNASDKPVSYSISVKFDPSLFASIKAAEGKPAVALRIPNIISTRSVTEKPGGLFAPQPIIKEEEPQ